MRRSSLCWLMCLGCASCAKPVRTEPSTAFAGFQVQMTYTPRALDLLAKRHVGVEAFGYYFGFPKSGTPRQYVSDQGEVGGLGSFRVAGRPGAPLRIPASTFSDAALDRITDEEPKVLVNVVSSRRASSDNLLDCTIYEGPAKAIENTTLPIACKLIGE